MGITLGVFKEVKILCMVLSWSLHVIINLSKCIESTAPRVDPKGNYGLWVIIMCHRSFFSCNKVTTDRDVEPGGEAR